MRSAWWWGTEQWATYQAAYYSDRPQVAEWKSSPLANDHDLGDVPDGYEIVTRQTQVIDLSYPLPTLWQGVRKSYHSIIHRANEQWEVEAEQTHPSMLLYQSLHAKANGRQPRVDATYECQEKWLRGGHGLLVSAHDWDNCAMWAACSYWIVYKGCAYYASGPAIERNVQHAVIWKSLELLKARGIQFVEMGQIDGETEKEINIGKFKAGFGGRPVPFQIVRKVQGR